MPTLLEYLYDRLNMLENENRILRELEKCRSKLEEVKSDLVREKGINTALRIELLELKNAHQEIDHEKKRRNKQFDDNFVKSILEAKRN